MDGFAVCAALKASEQTAHIPVIMVTALDTPEERIRGLEAGADDFLSKPFNDLALFAPGPEPDADEDDVRRAAPARHDLARARARGPGVGAGERGGSRAGRADPAGAAERRAGHPLGRAAARPAEDPDHRHAFRARGAEPRAAGIAGLLRGPPGAGRGRRRAQAGLGAALAAGDPAVGGDPRGRERRRADRGQGARSRARRTISNRRSTSAS